MSRDKIDRKDATSDGAGTSS